MKGRRVLARLGSVRLAAWLLGALILVMVLAVTVPQHKEFDTSGYEGFRASHPVASQVFAATGLDHLFTGWPIVVLTFLLVLNVSACTLDRIRARRRVFGSLREEHPLDAADLASARELLQEHRWKVFGTQRGLLAVKGTSGFWGSMVLHLSLLVLAAGGILTVLTAFRGDLVLTEGESVYDRRASYSKVYKEPRIIEPYSEALISQGDVNVKYDGDVLVEVASQLRVLDSAGSLASKAVRVNHPLDAAGKSFLLLNSGYAVAMVVGVPGSDPAPTVLRLAEQTSRGWADSTQVPLSGGKVGTLRILASPVPLGADEKLPVRTYEFKDPRLSVELLVDGGVIDKANLAEGESATLGGEVQLTFEDLRFWNKYLVRGEPGRWLTYVGLWMCVIGTAWRFLVPERRIAVTSSASGREPSVSYTSRPWGSAAGSDSDLVERVRASIIPRDAGSR